MRIEKANDEDYLYSENRDNYLNYDQIEHLVEHNLKVNEGKRTHIIDARSQRAYERGKVPTSKNIHYLELLNEDFIFKSVEELKEIFLHHGINEPQDERIVCMCQRGVSSCIIDLALRHLGNTKSQLYDGSFEEYGQKHSSAK